MGTIAATVDNNRARVAVQLTSFPDVDTVIYRVAGAARLPVRGGNPVRPSGGTTLVYDYEAPLGSPVTYEAFDGTATRKSVGVTLETALNWLKAPSYPALNMPVRFSVMPSQERTRRQSAFQVLGRRDPIVISDVRSSTSGAMSLVTLTDEEADALSAVLNEALVVLLQVPGSRYGSRYLALGDVTETPIIGKRAMPESRWEVAFQEVAYPPGGVVGDPTGTWQLVKDYYPTWGDLQANESTWLDLLAGVDLVPVRSSTLVTASRASTWQVAEVLLTSVSASRASTWNVAASTNTTVSVSASRGSTWNVAADAATGKGVDELARASLALVYSSTWSSYKAAADTYTFHASGTNDHVAINDAIAAVAAQGGGKVQLLGDLFNIGGSIILRTGVILSGEGLGTRIVASAGFQAGMVTLFDNSVHATKLTDMFLDGNGQEVHGVRYIANGGQIFTSVPDTNPDPAHIIRDLLIKNMGSSTYAGHGMWFSGGNLRAMKVSDIRIQVARGCGVWIDGAVDSHYTNIEIGSSGSGGPAASITSTAPVGHGFFVSQGDNNMFTACKAYFNRYAGFYNRGTRNGYTNCQAQDNYGNGFHGAFGKSSYVNCHADSNGQGVSATLGQAGFFLSSDHNNVIGCQSYDKAESGTAWQQQTGFHVTGGFDYSRISGCVTYGNVQSSIVPAAADIPGTTIDIVADAVGG